MVKIKNKISMNNKVVRKMNFIVVLICYKIDIAKFFKIQWF